HSPEYQHGPNVMRGAINLQPFRQIPAEIFMIPVGFEFAAEVSSDLPGHAVKELSKHRYPEFPIC
ncbi:TPA: hypothetical protein ACN1DT_004471, partial [Escherichia coli]